MDISDIKIIVPNCPICDSLMEEKSFIPIDNYHNKEYKCINNEYSIRFNYLNAVGEQTYKIVEVFNFDGLVIFSSSGNYCSDMHINNKVMYIPKISFLDKKSTKEEVLNKLRRYLLLV